MLSAEYGVHQLVVLLLQFLFRLIDVVMLGHWAELEDRLLIGAGLASHVLAPSPNLETDSHPLLSSSFLSSFPQVGCFHDTNAWVALV